MLSSRLSPGGNGPVASRSIRPRILKDNRGVRTNWQGPCCIPLDPTEDTESWWSYSTSHGIARRCIPLDPTEDTERILHGLGTLPRRPVASRSIRPRILKGPGGLPTGRWLAPRCIPLDPTEDTESCDAFFLSRGGAKLHPARSDRGY